MFKGAEAKEATEESVEVVVREDEDSAVVRRRKEAEREIEVMLIMIHPFCGLVKVVRTQKEVYLNI